MVGKFFKLKIPSTNWLAIPKPSIFYDLDDIGLTIFMTMFEKKKILLAEDDTSMRRFIEIILQKAGFEVLPAEDGLAAMQIALENEFDAVIADAIMPNMSGYDLCRIIRANSPEKKILCVILSGLAENNSDNNLADAFLLKDTNLKEQLLSALQTLF